MTRSETATAESIMSDETDRISVMHERIIAGDFLVDRDQYLFFTNQLQQVTQLYALALNHLPNGHGGWHIAREIAFTVGCLELSHERNGYHLLTELPCNPVDSLREARR